ncbi:MAG: sulfatase-like hydrolase/transferase [Pirellulales bacterium]
MGHSCTGTPPNFPTSLAAAGYQTYHHGKRGNTATHIQAHFEINKYLKDDTQERLDGEPGKEIVDEAITFLESRSQSEREKSRPFFMYLAFGNPHDPRVAAEEYRAQYKTEALPLPKNYLPVHPFNNGELTVRDERLAPWPRTEAEIRKQLHDYYATITAFDHHLGRLLDVVNELGLEENTIVIFSADQGLAMGSHGLMGKQNLYEHSTRSPLLFAGPGIPGGRTKAMVYLMDIYPTVCEMAGAATPEGIDGRSFAKVLRGKTETHRDAIFCAYQGVQRAVARRAIQDHSLSAHQSDAAFRFDERSGRGRRSVRSARTERTRRANAGRDEDTTKGVRRLDAANDGTCGFRNVRFQKRCAGSAAKKAKEKLTFLQRLRLRRTVWTAETPALAMPTFSQGLRSTK